MLMKDLLEYVGIKPAEAGAKWVDFFGPSGEVPNGDTSQVRSTFSLHAACTCTFYYRVAENLVERLNKSTGYRPT